MPNEYEVLPRPIGQAARRKCKKKKWPVFTTQRNLLPSAYIPFAAIAPMGSYVATNDATAKMISSSEIRLYLSQIIRQTLKDRKSLSLSSSPCSALGSSTSASGGALPRCQVAFPG